MSHPFEKTDELYLVLVNSENHHSLWPERLPVPAGWVCAHPADTRRACLDYADSHWPDLRPPGREASSPAHDSEHRSGEGRP
jgi:MbtH protein